MILRDWFEGESRITLICTIISGIALVLSFTNLLGGFIAWDWAWIAVVLCGIPIIGGAAKGLIKEHDIKADLLVSIALIASVLVQEYFAAGEVAFIMQIGSLLEDFTAGKAQEGIANLLKLTPQTARIKRESGEEIIKAEEVQPGDLLVVLAGETIPVDGIILEGETSIDQAVMTGESIPVDKRAGDSVISGTINQFGTFIMQAEKLGQDSSLQRLISLAQQADANKAPIVKLADRWASWLVVASLATALITGLVTGEILRAITVLVVFCPCAFILATPTAVAAGIGCLSRKGILIRSGDALERLAKIQSVAFDKTGTLTLGKSQVLEITSEANDPAEVLRLAAWAEQRSEHPLGKAIVNYYLEQGGQLEPLENFEMLAGRGVRAIISGQTVLVGKADWLREEGLAIPAEATGATLIYVAVGQNYLGRLALGDTLRPNAKEVLERLQADGLEPLLLTGDNQAAAQVIAEQLGLKHYWANLLPEAKMQIIQQYPKPIAMVGDGVNDALALKTASAGIAMGGIGSDIAVESADAVLVEDDLKHLPFLLQIVKKVMRKVKQNIGLSLSINFAAVLLAAMGVLNPVTGALVHNCGSVLVVINAALILWAKEPLL